MNVAVCGPLGAGCTEVGQLLAKKLGFKCVSSSDIIKVIVSDFRESFGEFELRVRSGEVDLDKMIDSEIDDILKHGETVVEGRSGFMLLDNPAVFKVLLVAPSTKRAEHIAKRRNVTIEEAKEDIEKSDKERKSMVERLFNMEWLDPSNYDIVVNTGPKSYEDVSEVLVKAIKTLQK